MRKNVNAAHQRKGAPLLILLSCILICAAVCLLTSCSLFGSNEKVEPVTVESVALLKTDADYLDSQEYEYNGAGDNPMAISSGAEFFISIVYNNPKKYPISYVTITPEDEGAQKIMSNDFESKSTKTNSVIRLKAPTTTANNVDYSFTIKNIFYNTGSETKRIKFSEDTKTDFTLKVNPTFTMTLNFQNADRRSTSQNPIAEVRTVNNVNFGAEMSTLGVVTTDYTKPEILPTKEGGWVFEGWFTKPNGEGILVRGDDKYYFWSNVTLYAYYTRLFKYDVVTLDEPIVHAYDGYVDNRGTAKHVTGTIEFHSGVVITQDDTKGSFPNLSIDDTIVDEKVTESGAVTATEYPVIKIANNAFKDKNNIETLRIGKYVSEIGYRAFSNCNKLANASFAEGSVLKYIGDFAFENTKSMGDLYSFTLPSTVEYIGNFAFRYSGWGNTNNNGRNERILHIKPTYKFIGAGAFFNTKFSTVIFEEGCHFDSQIGYDESKDIEKSSGWTDIRSDLNRIGANIFGNTPNLKEVTFRSDEGEANALNIIPDRAFDAGQYGDVTGIETLTFAEGIEYIGNESFNYQEKIPFLEIPATVKEIGIKAFYNNVSAETLTFKTGSKLEVLHSQCFGNLALIDSIIIISENFRKYGNGPFAGCGRLKLIQFPNVNTVDQVPKGFSEEENSDEVMKFHYFSDMMYGTFQTGTNTDEATAQQSSYSLPTRVFCKSGLNGAVLNKFKDNLLAGKEEYTVVGGRKVSSGTSAYESSVFVHNIENIKTYLNPGDNKEVQIALQEIYSASGGENSPPIAYSLVYWSERSKNIVLPESVEGLSYSLPITELAMYALPTSVVTLTVPGNFSRFEHDALNGCVNLETIEFSDPNALEYVGDFAFFGTRITSFTGGTNLKVIGKQAFMRCKALKWVDLMNTDIVNEVAQGIDGGINRSMSITQYKYKYELEKKNGKDPTDYRNTLADSAFQGCTNLSWVSLPRNLQQVNAGLFTNCTNLRTVIIPCVISNKAYDPNDVNKSLSQTNNEAFYYRNMPATIFDDKAMSYLKIYAPSNYMDAHKAIFPGSTEAITNARYQLLDEDNLPAKPQ